MGLIKIKIKKKNKKNKNNGKYKYNKFEIVFNLLSIAVVLGTGIYFGARALYYYSKQNVKMQDEADTLNGWILNNNKVVEGDGLHQDSNGYYFKGKDANNYVSFANRMFRVIRVNNDNSVRLISDEIVSSFMWGEEEGYDKSNVRNWITKTDSEHSGVYYKTIPSISDFLVETRYRIDKMLDEKIEFADQEMKDLVTILSLEDYVLAGGKSSFLNNGKLFYLLGIDEDKNYLSVLEDGSLEIIDNYSGYGIRPVITLKPNSGVVSGNGSKDDPYVIKQDNKINYVGNYVKLGNDIWKVYQDENNVLRLYLNDYIKTSEGVVVNNYYSKYNSIFDIAEDDSLAYYLNKVYVFGLTYKDLLLDSNYYVGEISDDVGYNFENIYKRPVPIKVGLLNIFDYHPNFDKEQYFYINTTSEIGDMQYVNNAIGLLLEENVREARGIIPTISISKKIIKSGKGTLEEPFVVE